MRGGWGSLMNTVSVAFLSDYMICMGRGLREFFNACCELWSCFCLLTLQLLSLPFKTPLAYCFCSISTRISY
jgi:hypothetical protein